jgi:hypothetical protein
MSLAGVGKRKQIRRPLARKAIIDAGDEAAPIACHTEDVSQSGARVVIDGMETAPDTFVLRLSADGKVRRRCRVAWRNKNALGVIFY